MTVMFVSPSALASPCKKNPDHPNCTGSGDDEPYDFKVLFEGEGSLLYNDEGAPWEISSITGGHGNIGPSPVGPITLNGSRIAEIGDHVQPCGISDSESCAALLDGMNPLHYGLTFRRNVSGEDPVLGNVSMYSGFDWVDYDLTEYHFGIKNLGWADLDAHPWDPTDPEFCVPMEISHVWILQTLPVIKKRNKQCRISEYFATCEAGVDELQFPLPAGDFRVTIWRVDSNGLPDSPPCEF